MANSKRVKSGGKTSKQHMAAKSAIKKKAKGAVKFHNDQLRTILDKQTPTLYSMNQLIKKAVEPRSDNFQSDVQELTSTLGNL